MTTTTTTTTMPRRNHQRNGSPKRVRLEEPQKQAEKHKKTNQAPSSSPTAAALSALESSIASLPDNLHPITRHFGQKHAELRAKLLNKIAMKTKLSADPAYIPRSARATAFKVTLSTTAAEHSADRLEFLQAQAQQAKDAYESALRTIVSECIDLEIEALKHSEKNIICESLNALSTATSVFHNTPCDAHLRTANLVKLDGKNLFKYTSFTNTQSLKEHYESHLGTALPPPTLATADPDNYDNPADYQAALAQVTASHQLPENKGLQTYRKTMETILVLPHRAFVQQQQTNENATRLKKLATELIDGTATEATAMELEGEHSTNIQHLQDLIRKESSKRDKKMEELTKKCAKLENIVEFMTAKNTTQRGSPSASQKKKSSNCQKGKASPTPSQRANSPKPRDAAAASDNATTGNSGARRNRRRSGSASPRKRSNSRSGKRRPNRGSANN